jgi:hypothetical protein
MLTATLTPVVGQLLRDAEVAQTDSEPPQITLTLSCPSPPIPDVVDVKDTWVKATLAGPAATYALGVLRRLKRGVTVQLDGALTRYALDRAYGRTIARCTMTAEALRLPRGA